MHSGAIAEGTYVFEGTYFITEGIGKFALQISAKPRDTGVWFAHM